MELVATLDEAHAQIGQELKNKNTDTALSLLGQCQECAVTIGETIEASEG